MTKTCKYFLLVLILISSISHAQNGWIESYDNSNFGRTIKERAQGGYSIAGFKGIDRKNVVFIQTDASGEELTRFIYNDFNKDYTFQTEHVELLLTEDDGLMITAYSDTNATSPFLTLIKYDSQGNLEWTENYLTPSDFRIVSLTEFNSGYVFGGINRLDATSTFISKTDLQGNVEWSNILVDSIFLEDIEVDNNGIVWTLGRKSLEINSELFSGYALSSFGPGGIVLSTSIIDLDYVVYDINIEDILLLDDGSITAVGSVKNRLDGNNLTQLLVLKVTDIGQILDVDAYQINEAETTSGLSIIKGWNNGLVTCGYTENGNARSSFYLRLTENGFIDWSSNDELFDYGVSLNQVITSSDSGYVFVGLKSNSFGRIQAIKANQNGLIRTNTIEGSVFSDQNENCSLDSNELIIKNAFITLTNLQTSETITQWHNDFNYEFRVDPGRYLVTSYFIDLVWAIQCDSVIVEVTEENSVFTANIPLLPLFDCPLMTVDLTTPILQRCEESIYTVQAVNIGTQIAEDAYLTIDLDPTIDLIESNRPFEILGNNSYKFQLGDVNIASARTINLLVDVSCDSTVIGQTHCIVAKAFPDSVCYEVDPNWDGSVIDVNGACTGDSVEFEISNDGFNPMNGPLRYYIVEDDAIFRIGDFSLQSGESISISVAANGATYRLETDENPGFIFGGRPSFTVEACGVEMIEDASLGFVNNFPLYDNSPFISIDCQESISDLEGNLHLAYPRGYSSERYIREGDELEYFIRFENKTAENISTVTIIDQLDEHVNLESLKIGVTSHPYQLEICENNLIKIHFNDINLPLAAPDNFGFVKFKIDLLPNLNLFTVIENDVYIQLDSNIITTDRVFHTIGEALTLSIDQYFRPNVNISTYPNPFTEQAQLLIEGINVQEWTIKIYAIDGTLQRQAIQYGNRSTIHRGNLSQGLYFFTIEDNDGMISSGKLSIGR